MAAYAIQFRRGTTTQHNSFTGLLGEVTVDTDKNTLVVHDGSTTGGFPLAREGAASTASTGSFTSNVTVGGTLAVTSTTSFGDDVTINGDLGMTGHIIPSANITYDLGSTTMMWRDVYVGPGSLYINGQKVLEDNSGTIKMSADANQNIKIESTGTGALQFVGAGGLQISGEVNALTGDLQFGDHLDMNSNRIKEVSAPVVGSDAANKTYVDSTISTKLGDGSLSFDGINGDFSGDLTVTGNLEVQGTTTTINTTQINLADNILLLNSDATGSASVNAGIEVERGDDLNVQFLWDETNDRWSLGAKDLYTSGALLGDVKHTDGTVLVDMSAKSATFAGGVVANLTGNVIGDVTGDVTGTVTSLSNHNTDNLNEGTNNLYWTQARTDARVDALNDYLTGLAFNTSSGVLTADMRFSSDVTVDLDGRYHLLSDDLDNYVSWNAKDADGDTYEVTSGAALKFAAGWGADTDFTSTGVLTISADQTALDARYLQIADFDTNDNHLTAHTFNTSNGVLTSTLADTSTVTVDLDGRYALASDLTSEISDRQNDEDYVSSGSFDTATGDVTLTRRLGGTVTYNLDGRYQAAGSYQPAGDYDNYVSWTASDGTSTAAVTSGETVKVVGGGDTSVSFDATTQTFTISSTNTTDTNDYVDSASLSGSTLTLGRTGTLADLTVDLSSLLDDSNLARIDEAGFNTVSGVLTLTRDDDTTVTVDLDGRYYEKDSTDFESDVDTRIGNNTGANLDLSQKNTDNLDEGSNNLYFTNARAVAAVKSAMSMTHSSVYVVTAADESGNTNSSHAINATTLGFDMTGAEYFQVYLNRQLLRPSEFSVNTGNGTITFTQNVIFTDDEIEVVMYK